MFSGFSHANKNLKIIIVGNGKVGHTLIEQLSKEGNNITVDADGTYVVEIAFDAAGNGTVTVTAK